MMTFRLFGKNMSVTFRRGVMCIIDHFVEETHPGKSPWTKENVLPLIRFLSLDQIPNINIYHMLSKEHPELIEGRRQLIAVDVLEPEEADKDASIDNDGDASDEYNVSGLVGADVTEEVKDIQKAVKSSYLSSYILKPSHLLTQGFEKNGMVQEKLFKHICDLEEGEKSCQFLS